MRLSTLPILPAALLASLVAAIQLPDLQPFLAALPELFQSHLPDPLQNTTAHDLLKRQQNSDSCPNGFNSCANLGAAGLCCMSNAVCSADQAGHVACCPSRAVCTGTIGGVITAGTIDGNGGLVGGAGPTATTSFQLAGTMTNGGGGLVQATATAPPDGGLATGNGGFIIDGGNTVAVPAAGVRRAEIPGMVAAVIYILEFLPL